MTDYMYHPGDRVRVRRDLSENEDYKMLSGKNKGQCWLAPPWMKNTQDKRSSFKRSHKFAVFIKHRESMAASGLTRCLSRLSWTSAFVIHCCNEMEEVERCQDIISTKTERKWLFGLIWSAVFSIICVPVTEQTMSVLPYLFSGAAAWHCGSYCRQAQWSLLHRRRLWVRSVDGRDVCSAQRMYLHAAAVR